MFLQPCCPNEISPTGNSGCVPRGKPAATESRYPTYCAYWVFECFHNPPNSDMNYRIFNVRTYVNACDCTRGCTDRRKSVCTESWLREKSIAAPGNRTCVSGVTVRCSNQLSYMIPTRTCYHRLNLNRNHWAMASTRGRGAEIDELPSGAAWAGKLSLTSVSVSNLRSPCSSFSTSDRPSYSRLSSLQHDFSLLLSNLFFSFSFSFSCCWFPHFAVPSPLFVSPPHPCRFSLGSDRRRNNDNNNEIFIKRESLVYTRARRAVQKRKKERLGQHNSNNKLNHGQYTSRYNLHLSLSLSLPPLPPSLSSICPLLREWGWVGSFFFKTVVHPSVVFDFPCSCTCSFVREIIVINETINQLLCPAWTGRQTIDRPTKRTDEGREGLGTDVSKNYFWVHWFD